jgi:rhomboid protease GluP
MAEPSESDVVDLKNKSINTGLAPELAVELVRPQFWTSGLIFFLGVSGMVMANLIASIAALVASGAPIEAMGAPATLVVVGFAVVGVVVGRRIVAHLRPLPPISFFADHLTLPPDTTALKARRIDYSDILTIAVRGDAPRGLLVLESRRYLVVYAFAAFKQPDGATVTIEELNRRIGALPQGAAMVERAEKRQTLAEQAMSRRPWATQALIGVLVVIFVNQLLAGSFEQVLGAVRWGANSAVLVKNGEYFRLMSANFLHGGSAHLLFNLVALWLVGGLLERLLGWARFTTIYLSSGIAAMGASALLGAGTQSVGASGAIFGILGGLAVVNWRYRTELPLGFRQPLRWWLMILALNAALPVLLPLITMARVDVAAHAAGFVFGIAVTFGLIEREKRLQIAVPASPLLYAVTFGLIAVNAFSIGRAVIYAARFDSTTRVQVSRLLIGEPELGPEGLNEVAWGLAVDPGTTSDGLAVAHEAALRAIAALPKETTFADTLASVEFRRGELDVAVDLERQALEAEPSVVGVSPAGRFMVRFIAGPDGGVAAGASFYAAQLSRFLKARLAKSGPIVPAGTPAPSLRIVPPADNAAIGALATAVLELDEPVAEGLSLYALAAKNDETIGLVRVTVAAGGGARYDIQLPAEASDALGVKRLELTVVLIVRPGIDPLPEGTAALRFWAHDKQVDALP